MSNQFQMFRGARLKIIQGRAIIRIGRVVDPTDASAPGISIEIVDATPDAVFSVDIGSETQELFDRPVNPSSDVALSGDLDGVVFQKLRNDDDSHTVLFKLTTSSPRRFFIHLLNSPLAIQDVSNYIKGYPTPKSFFYPGKDLNVFVGYPSSPINSAVRALLERLSSNVAPIDALAAGEFGSRPWYSELRKESSIVSPMRDALQSSKFCSDSFMSLDGQTNLNSHGVHGWVFGSMPDCYDGVHEGSDIRAFANTKIYSMFDSTLVDVHRSWRSGGTIETSLGDFVAANNTVYEVRIRYMHLDPCRIKNLRDEGPLSTNELNRGVVGISKTIQAGDFLGYVANPRENRPVRVGDCLIKFSSHLHVDGIAINKSDPARTAHFFDPILFINQIVRFQKSTTSPQTALDRPKFFDWRFERCTAGGISSSQAVLGKKNLCYLSIDVEKSSLKPVRARFSYELFYNTASGKTESLKVPETDEWIAPLGGNVTATITASSLAAGKYNFVLPISVRLRTDRLYHRVKVVGDVYFNNGTFKRVDGSLELIR
ncbi:hypothetical protein [Deinococcus hohokamensis]|uniref:Uncharacterized protein n=1 Tax=Deinococcus hohokamensis TaxID=309883 RepID=A0ABV9IEJ8_9DEIO